MAEEKTIVRRDADFMSLEDIKARAHALKEMVGNLLVKDQDFGVIPGTGSKPTLLQPGAQKIDTRFRLACRTKDIIEKELPAAHREYRIVVEMIHIPTGDVWGEGVGICSTMESKYRYREDKREEDTGQPVPKEYWDTPKESRTKEVRERILGPHGFIKKGPDGWTIIRREGTGEKVENPDIADTYNTVFKMCFKRAHVCGTINATAASDFFTQDVEDFTGTSTRDDVVLDAKIVDETTPEGLRKEAITLATMLSDAKLISDEEYEEMVKTARARKSVDTLQKVIARIREIKREREDKAVASGEMVY
uniref:Uncharacterized protein n=1 Tax=viral metagenome TaxID=1070528 RepID=A0A6M3LIE2_9ZZZZ